METYLDSNDFQYIFDQLPMRIFWKDKYSRYIGCNSLFAIDAGLGDAAEIFGKLDADLPWSSDASVMVANDKKIINSGIPFQSDEVTFKDTQGKHSWSHVNKVPLRNKSGEIIGVLGVYENVISFNSIKASDFAIRRAFKLLVDSNHAVSRAHDEKSLFSMMCQLAVDAGYRMAWIGLINFDNEKSIIPVAHYGVADDYLNKVKISWSDNQYGKGPTGISIRENRSVVNQNFLINPSMEPWRDAAIKAGYQSSIALPIGNDEVGLIGSFAVYANEANAFNADEVKLLEEMAHALGIGVDAIRERKKHNDALISTVEALAATVELRDPYTAGHQKKVATVAAAIASEMGLSAHDIEGIRLAGMIHDIGKIGIPAEILTKPTKLSALEYELIKTHPDIGYKVLKDIPFPWPIADLVRQHHERLDGNGYPLGLYGDEIILGARIIAVADVVDAMMSHRPYRPALGREKTLAALNEGRGVLYDSTVVDVWMKISNLNED